MGFRSLLIAVAVFGLGWGASFGAGVAYGHRNQPAQVQAATTAGGQLGQNAQAGQGRGVFGTVNRVDGKTLYVSEANNQQVKVNLVDQTRITKQAAGDVSDLTAGARVTVQAQGQAAADGTITAATISIVPEGQVGGQAQGATGAQGAQGGQRGGQGGGQNGGQRAVPQAG